MTHTREFTPRSMAYKGLHPDVFKTMDGSPQGGFYPAKIGFNVEMLLAKPPTVVKHIEEQSKRVLDAETPHMGSNLLPRAIDVRKLPASLLPRALFRASDGTAIKALVLHPTGTTGLNFSGRASLAIRDMDADHLWYVYEGSGGCYTDFGVLSFAAGDFIYIPRHTLACFVAPMGAAMIGIHSMKGLRLPTRRPYDNVDVPFNDFGVRLPEPYGTNGGPEIKYVFVDRGGERSCVEYAYTPFLCVAWKGAPYPFAIHTSKLNLPYVQSIHPDPSNFAVFASPDASAVVSVLGPRFVHSLPYAHLNEWDELLFYAKEYNARKGSGGGVGDSGTATLHPQGIWHGPQMAAFKHWQGPQSPKDIPWVDDLAIMFETRAPLKLCEGATDVLIPGYEKSWLEGWEEHRARQGHPSGLEA